MGTSWRIRSPAKDPPRFGGHVRGRAVFLALLALALSAAACSMAPPVTPSLTPVPAASTPTTAVSPTAPPSSSSYPPLSSDRLREHMNFLASDEMAGRLPTGPEYNRAADYAARVFAGAGLSPGAEDAQGKPAFFQDVPFVAYELGESNSLVLTTTAGVETRRYGANYVFINPGKSRQTPGDGRVVYVGYGIHEPEYGWDDLAGLDLKDAFVIFETGAPVGAPGFDLPADLSADYAANDFRKVKVLIEKGAAAIAFLPPADTSWDLVFMQLRWLPYYLQPSTEDHPPILVLSPDFAGKLFSREVYNPLQRAGTYRPFELPGTRMQLSVDLQNRSFKSPNVVAVVKGTDSTLSDEYIVLTAHLDHLGIRDGQVYNGANDNATGCAVVLSVAESLAANPPKRSVMFVLFTAEEAGHYGADYFVAYPPVPLISMKANVNLEVLGGVDPSVSQIGALGPAGFLPSVRDAVKATGYTNVDFTEFEQDMSNYRKSDQLSFFMKGIPAVEIGSGASTEYHTPQDDIDLIDFDHMHRATVFVEKLVQSLANKE